jgi:uncharacterized membrane protein YecN with MAPEG domain
MGLVELPITLTAAGAAAIVNIWLAMRVGAVRRAAGVSIGDGGDAGLIARMRAQANFVEYAPFILILIGLIELAQGPSTWLWLAAVAFLLARIAHPLGMDGVRYCRMVGTLVTMLLMLGLAIYAVLLPFGLGHVRPSSAPIELAPSQG